MLALSPAPALSEALDHARAIVNLRSCARPIPATPNLDPTLYLVEGDDGDNPVGCPTLVVGDEARDHEVLAMQHMQCVTVTVTPIGPMSGINTTHLREHLLAHHSNGGA